MKVAVSIPESVFADAERLARQLETTRSDLYARALSEFVAGHASDRITHAINAVIDEVGTDPDPFVQAAARKVFERVDW